MFTWLRAIRAGAVVIGLAAFPLVCAEPGRAQSGGADQTVTRIGDYVVRYYERAQSLVAEESVAVQPLDRDLTPSGFPRRLLYEFRLEWKPDATGDESPATITRQLLAINGKPPRPRDEPKCLDPRSASPEPLAFLLPDRRHKFAFASAGVGRFDGRPAVMLDYRSIKEEPPTATIDEKDKDCIMFDLPGRSRGRVWADPETAEIIRLDERLTGMVDVPMPRKSKRTDLPIYWTIERADMSMVYSRVTFHDPEESLLLPSRVDTTTVIRGGGVQRLRVTQTFANYRRFITGTRIVD